MRKMSKKKKIVVLFCLVTALLVTVIFVYLKGTKHYNYDELPGEIDVIYKDDDVYFYGEFNASGGVDYTGKAGKENHELDPGNMITIPGKELLYMDEETGLPCYRVFVYFVSCPWDMTFHSEYHSILGSAMTHDGIPLGYTNKEGELNCNHRVVEFCYLNRNGSYVTLWKRGDTP